MDKSAQGLAQKILNELASIKRLIHDAVSLPQHKQGGSATNHNQSNDGENQEGEITPVVAPSKIPPKVKPSIPSKGASQDKEDDSHPWLIRHKAAFEFVGLVVLTIYTGVTVGLWFSSLEANKSSREETHRSHRPWLSVADPISVTRPLTFENDRASIRASYVTKNSGTSPALGAISLTEFVFITGTTIDMGTLRDKLQCYPGRTPKLAGSKFGMSVFPGQEFTTKDGEMATKVKPADEPVQLWLLNCIVYEDEFGLPHGTGSSWQYIPKSGDRPFYMRGTIDGTLQQSVVSSAY